MAIGAIALSGEERSKYDLKSTSYPPDLFDNASKYGEAWIMFNINVQSNSITAQKDSIIDLNEAELQKQGTTGRGISATGTGSVGGTMATAAAIGGATGGGISAVGQLMSGKTAGLASAGAGAIKGAALGAFASLPYVMAGQTKRTTKRIKTAIQLPMPNNFSSNYSLDWNQESTLLYDMLMRIPEAGGAIAKSLTGDISGLKQIGDAGTAASLGLSGLANSGAISAATGMAANTKKEMVFGGVNFRSFTFTYKFFPNSAEDSYRLNQIIYLFKKHAHPEYFRESRYTFIYPSEFDITFYAKSHENLLVNRISTCILRDISINYTPDGLWANHEHGAPVSCELNMTFQELGIHTKETIDQAF